MSFLVPCPNCGVRDVYEFRWGGEYRVRPSRDVSPHEWADYLYARANQAGVQKEWWFHDRGCRRWFFALRDTRTNKVLETSWP